VSTTTSPRLPAHDPGARPYDGDATASATARSARLISKPYHLDMQRAVLSRGLDLLVEAKTPGITWVTPYEWSADHSWKDKVFSKGRPFLDPAAARKRLERKDRYRTLKATGKV